MALLRPRSKTLLEITRQARIYISDTIELDPVAAEKSLKGPEIRKNLGTLADRLAAMPDFAPPYIEAAIRGFAEELGIKPGVLMGAARVALTGQTVSPGIFEVMSILGCEKTVVRLRKVATS